MRWMLPGLALLLALAVGVSAFATAPQASAPSLVLHASAVDFNVTVTDPTGDVARFWTSNNTHVTNATGSWVLGATPREVDLTRLTTVDAGSEVSLAIRVRSAIATLPTVSYEIRIYPRVDNSTRYLLDYVNGLTSLREDRSGASSTNLTGSTTIAPGSTLTVVVNKTLLGGAAAIGAWSVDASALEVAGNYTFKDSIWQVPGDPDSAPAFVVGRVTDAASGAGLAGVSVQAAPGGFAATTNATGYYSLPAAPGNLTVTFSLSGYDSTSGQIRVQAQQTQSLDAQLSQASLLGGSSGIWIVLAAVVIVVAAVLVVLFLILRRRRGTPPKEVPPPPGAP